MSDDHYIFWSGKHEKRHIECGQPTWGLHSQMHWVSRRVNNGIFLSKSGYYSSLSLEQFHLLESGHSRLHRLYLCRRDSHHPRTITQQYLHRHGLHVSHTRHFKTGLDVLRRSSTYGRVSSCSTRVDHVPPSCSTHILLIGILSSSPPHSSGLVPG